MPKEVLLHMHRHFKTSLLHRVSVRRGGHVELSARAASCVSQLVFFFCLRLELNRFVLCVCLCARGSPCVVADCLTYPFNVSRAIMIMIMDKSVGWV